MIKINGITKDYENFFNHCIQLAQEVLIRDGNHTPMCLVFTKDKKIQPFLCRYRNQAEKQKWFEDFRNTFLEELDAKAVIFISEGYRINLDTALAICLTTSQNHRQPEPLYMADHLSRGEVKKYLSKLKQEYDFKVT